MFLLKKILSAFVLPPASPLLLAAFGLWLARSRPRLGHGLVAVGLGSLWLLSTPWVADQFLLTLQRDPPITGAALKGAQAIVVLGAGSYRDAPEYGGDTVNELALERLRYGARLARASGLPLAVTGGAPSGGQPEGESMRQALAADFGIKARWIETTSRDTAENAALLSAILRKDGITRIALVTHVWHIPRSRLLFEHQGMVVLPAPTRFVDEGPEGVDSAVADWLPSTRALRNSYWAAHEWLGYWASIMRLSAERHLSSDRS